MLKISRLFPILTRPLIIAASLISLISCEKEPGIIGLEVTPPLDQLHVETIDTSTIIAYSVLVDSIQTSGLYHNILGSIHDPVFGRTDASIYTQLNLSTVGVDFGSNPKCDSLVLYLRYNGYYGDTNTPLTVRLYEISEDIYSDSLYYSTTHIDTYNNEIGRQSIYPHPNDSVVINGDKAAPALRVRLDNCGKAFAEKLLAASSATLADNDEFVKYIKGLHIKTDPVNYHGSILYFDLKTSPSGMTLYYHNDDQDSLSFTYEVSSSCKRINHFDHEGYLFADPKLRQQIIYNDHTLGEQINYLQSMGGVKVRLWFPYLKDWAKNKKVGINEAELILTNIDETDEYLTPARLSLAITEDDGTLSSLYDQDSVSTTYYGGTYNSTTREYRIRLNYYVQDLVNQEDMGDGLSLMVAGSSINASRFVFAGPKAAKNRMRLRVVYSYSQ